MGKLRTLIKYGPKAVDVLRNKERYQDLLKKSILLLQGKSSLDSVRRQGLVLLNLLKDTVTLKYRGLSKRNTIMIAAGFLYLVNPLDLIPDFFGVFGFADDITILSMIFNKIGDEMRKYETWKLGCSGLGAEHWEQSVQENMTAEPKYRVEKVDVDEFERSVNRDQTGE